MQLRSGRCLVYPPPAPQGQGGRHRRKLLLGPDDRISSLPKDLLLQVLARLKYADEAARAGAVSRSWRGLWTELPELFFFCVEPRLLEVVLAKVTRPRLDLLDITLVAEGGTEVSSLLHAAARLVPEKLMVMVFNSRHSDRDDNAIELPCFDHTSSITLHLMGFQLFPPLSGEFTALKNLSLDCCCVDIGALLPLCPCLRVLKMCDLVEFDTMTVHSMFLEELTLKATNNDTRHVDIMGPMLKEVTLEVCVTKDFSLSFSAPMVKILEWDCQLSCLSVGVNGIWRLEGIHERKQHGFHVVSLIIRSASNPFDVERGFAELIAQLPVTAFSVLELNLRTEGHTFGPLVLHLLWIRPVIQSLKVVLAQRRVGLSCPVNCLCEQSSNWRSEIIPLTNLESVEIHGLQGKDDEVDFLKLILRSATVLMRLTITVTSDVSPRNDGYKKICNIMKGYPDVDYQVHSI